ncbi:MAG TPA: DUF87 domain-containing protein [Candidatus Bathyarchaeia archaeon]|nr:DUF87 domain-containing protein [Candidatus Bathyarchaeia archaeon]
MSVFLGFEKGTGSPVSVPITHTLIAGTTGSGKTVTMRSIIAQTRGGGYSVLIIDPKNPPDYAELEHIEPYVEKRGDPLSVKKLLEAKNKIWLRRELSYLIDAFKDNPSWDVALRRIQDRMKEKIHPIELKDLKVVELLLRELVTEMKEIDFADDLDLTPGKISVMDISKMTLGLQQLVVKSVATKILSETGSHVILVIDEFHRVAPRDKPSAAKDSIEIFIQEGRASSKWLYGSNQTVTGVDEAVRKQFQVWLLGRQNDVNEAKRVVDQVPGELKLSFKDVYQLKAGWFIANDFTEGTSRLIYVVPQGIDVNDGRKIAIGHSPPARLGPSKSEPTVTVSEIGLREQTTKVLELEGQVKEAKTDLARALDDVDRLTQEKTQLEATVEKFEEFKTLLKDFLGPAGSKTEQLDNTVRANLKLYVDNPTVPTAARDLLKVFQQTPKGTILTKSQAAIQARRSPRGGATLSGWAYLTRNKLVELTEGGVKLYGE